MIGLLETFRWEFPRPDWSGGMLFSRDWLVSLRIGRDEGSGCVGAEGTFSERSGAVGLVVGVGLPYGGVPPQPNLLPDGEGTRGVGRSGRDARWGCCLVCRPSRASGWHLCGGASDAG